MNRRREIPISETSTGSPNYGSNNSNSNSNPYVQISLVPNSPATTNRPNPMDTVHDALNRCGKRVEEATRHAENVADNFWNHFRVSSSLLEAAVARIVQGTKVLSQGGPDKLFQQTFGIFPGEKLLRPFACYISTPSGPVIGTLYVSTKRLAFCSDYPLCHYPISWQNHGIHYKVVVQLDQLSTVSPSNNRLNPAEKYVQVVTVDGYEFIFMGFIAYDTALKTLNKALQQCHSHFSANSSVQLL